MTESKAPALEDVGTRYQHLMDIREIWQNGIEAVSRIRPAYRSKADLDLQASLVVAVTLIDKQVDLLSKFDTKKYDLMREINAIPSATRLLVEGRKAANDSGGSAIAGDASTDSDRGGDFGGSVA